MILILLLFGGLTLERINGERSARAWIQHSDEVLRTIKDFDIALGDGESGERGYVLTGNEAYLAPYTASLEQVGVLEADLERLTLDNPAQQDRLGTLADLVGQEMEELGETVQLRRASGLNAAMDVVRTNAGLSRMERIETTVAAMTDEEQSLLATRLADADDRGVGVLALVLVGTSIGILTLLWATRRLNRVATTDTMTGLLSRNRIWALYEARNRLSRPPPTAVLLVDINRFRSVNQVFGPGTGDRILKEVARRLTSLCGRYHVGRIGADDFAICCIGVSPEQADELAGLILAAMAQPFEVHGRALHLTASVGVAHSDAAGDVNLRQGADDAIFDAKGRGGNQVVTFVPSMNHSRRQQAELEQQLHLALERDDELSLMYQPVIRIKDRTLVAVEALARWNHPRLGMIPPDRFIAIAEQRGMIDAVALKLFGIAFRQAALWRDRFPGRSPVVNLNVSPMQFVGGDVVADLRRLLREHHLPASAFCLEVTEGTFTNTAAIAALQAAQRLGFKVSMDDFGVGYSSLAQLPRLPLASVKLDRSFIVHDAEHASDAAMIGGIVQLAHALKLEVVAEGVEEPEQLDLVTRSGCDSVQGYIFSRPLKPEALESWLSNGATGEAQTSPLLETTAS